MAERRFTAVGRRGRIGHLAIALAGLALMSACGSQTPDADASDAAGYFQEWRDKAQAGGASTSQLDVLDAAAASGSLAHADIEPLLQEAYACFDANGLSYQVHEPDDAVPGFPYPRYGVGVDPRTTDLTDEQGEALAGECTARHLDFALDAYGSQPAAQSARDAQLQADLPEIKVCLAEYGVTVAEDATPDEVRQAVVDLYFDRATEEGEGPLCYDRLG